MAVELPEPLQWVLLLLAGCRWPEADEDQLRDMADECRKASETLRDATQGVDAAIKRALEGQQGEAADGLNKFWATYTVGKGTEDDPGRLTATINALSGMGDMLEQMANSAETAKIQIVAQLGILAFELATAEAEAPVTAGASMLQVPGFIAAARTFVTKTLKTLVLDLAKMAAKQAAQMAAINLMAQGIQVAEGHRKSIDWKEVGDNAKGGAIGGAAGGLIGKGLGAAAGKVGLGGAANSLGGKMAIGAATGVGADAATQYLTTGKVDTSSLLGSGLSGGAGVGLHHGAVKMNGHGPAPKPGDAPHIPGPVGPGEGGRQDGPPKFTKPDTSSGGDSSYHGPSGDSGSSSSGSSGSGSGSSGSSSGSGRSSGSGSGGSTAGGLSPFGSGRTSGDASPSHSETGGGRSHEQAPPPAHEQSGGGRSHEQAPPPAHDQSGGGRSHEQAPPPSHEQSGGGRNSADAPPPSHEQSGGGRSHEQAPPPAHEQSGGGKNHEQAEAVRPTHEPLTERIPSQPAHERTEAVRPTHEPLSGQEPSRPVHEQPVRNESGGSGRDNAPVGHESSAGDQGSVRPSGDDSAPRPNGGGAVPNLSGVLSGAAGLAGAASSSGHGGGGGNTGGTHLDGARSATLPRPDGATVPGQGMPEGLGDTSPNSGTQGPNQGAVPPMGGAGFAPGPVGGGSHIGGGSARTDAPPTSGAPRPGSQSGTVHSGGGSQQGGGSLRPGGGRGARPETHTAPEQQHTPAPKPTEHATAPNEHGGSNRPHEQQQSHEGSTRPHESQSYEGEPRPKTTDGRRIDEPGGLKQPSEHDQKRIEDAVPRDEDGKPQTHPDPQQGDWIKHLNGDGPFAPGRNNNCADAALSFMDTYNGHPTAAAPRVENNGAGEKGGRDRIEQSLGGRFEHQGAGAGGHDKLQKTLLESGPGSQALIISTDGEGRSHAWNVVNHDGKIVYVDPQMGRTSDKPLYAGEGGLFAVPLGPNGSALHPTNHGANQGAGHGTNQGGGNTGNHQAGARPETTPKTEAPPKKEAPPKPETSPRPEAQPKPETDSSARPESDTSPRPEEPRPDEVRPDEAPGGQTHEDPSPYPDLEDKRRIPTLEEMQEIGRRLGIPDDQLPVMVFVPDNATVSTPFSEYGAGRVGNLSEAGGKLTIGKIDGLNDGDGTAAATAISGKGGGAYVKGADGAPDVLIVNQRMNKNGFTQEHTIQHELGHHKQALDQLNIDKAQNNPALIEYHNILTNEVKFHEEGKKPRLTYQEKDGQGGLSTEDLKGVKRLLGLPEDGHLPPGRYWDTVAGMPKTPNEQVMFDQLEEAAGKEPYSKYPKVKQNFAKAYLVEHLNAHNRAAAAAAGGGTTTGPAPEAAPSAQQHAPAAPPVPPPSAGQHAPAAPPVPPPFAGQHAGSAPPVPPPRAQQHAGSAPPVPPPFAQQHAPAAPPVPPPFTQRPGGAAPEVPPSSRPTGGASSTNPFGDEHAGPSGSHPTPEMHNPFGDEHAASSGHNSPASEVSNPFGDEHAASSGHNSPSSEVSNPFGDEHANTSHTRAPESPGGLGDSTHPDSRPDSTQAGLRPDAEPAGLGGRNPLMDSQGLTPEGRKLLHQNPTGPSIVYPPSNSKGDHFGKALANKFKSDLSPELKDVSNHLPVKDGKTHQSEGSTASGKPNAKIKDHTFKAYVDPATLTLVEGGAGGQLREPLRNALGPDAVAYSGNKVFEEAAKLDYRSRPTMEQQHDRRQLLKDLADQNTEKGTWIDGDRVAGQLAGQGSAMEGVDRLLNGHGNDAGFPGVVLGEGHGQSATWPFLKDNMKQLKASGVDTIYLEALRDDAVQHDLDKYLDPSHEGPMPPTLQKAAARYDSSHGAKLTEVLEAAKANNVKVRAVDGYPARTINEDGGVHERARLMNSYAHDVISSDAANGGGKYVAVVGASHAHSTTGSGGAGRIPGTADLLGVPAVHLTHGSGTAHEAPPRASRDTSASEVRLSYLPTPENHFPAGTPTQHPDATHAPAPANPGGLGPVHPDAQAPHGSSEHLEGQGQPHDQHNQHEGTTDHQAANEHNNPGQPHEQPNHEQTSREQSSGGHEGGGPRHPATDGRPFDVEGGLKRPSEHDLKQLQDAVPHNADGSPQRHPDPMSGDWLKKLNGDGPGAPGRANNCADAALSLVDTYDGHPSVAAPRTEDNSVGEKGGRDRIEQSLGGKFEHLGSGQAGHDKLAQTLLDSGHGSQAVIISRDSEGRTHAWNAMNHNGKIVYADPQLGRTSDTPLYAGEGGLFAVPLTPDRAPLHPSGPPAGTTGHQAGPRPAHQPGGEELRPGASPGATEHAGSSQHTDGAHQTEQQQESHGDGEHPPVTPEPLPPVGTPEHGIMHDPAEFLKTKQVSVDFAAGVKERMPRVRSEEAAEFLEAIKGRDQHWFVLEPDGQTKNGEPSGYHLVPAWEKYAAHYEGFPRPDSGLPPVKADHEYVKGAYIPYKSEERPDPSRPDTIGHTEVPLNPHPDLPREGLVFTDAMNGCALVTTVDPGKGTFTAWHFQSYSSAGHLEGGYKFREQHTVTSWMGVGDYSHPLPLDFKPAATNMLKHGPNGWEMISQESHTYGGNSEAMKKFPPTLHPPQRIPFDVATQDPRTVVKMTLDPYHVIAQERLDRFQKAAHDLTTGLDPKNRALKDLQPLLSDMNDMLGAQNDLVKAYQRPNATLEDLQQLSNGLNRIKRSRQMFLDENRAAIERLAVDATPLHPNRSANTVLSEFGYSIEPGKPDWVDHMASDVAAQIRKRDDAAQQVPDDPAGVSSPRPPADPAGVSSPRSEHEPLPHESSAKMPAFTGKDDATANQVAGDQLVGLRTHTEQIYEQIRTNLGRLDLGQEGLTGGVPNSEVQYNLWSGNKKMVEQYGSAELTGEGQAENSHGFMMSRTEEHQRAIRELNEFYPEGWPPPDPGYQKEFINWLAENEKQGVAYDPVAIQQKFSELRAGARDRAGEYAPDGDEVYVGEHGARFKNAWDRASDDVAMHAALAMAGFRSFGLDEPQHGNPELSAHPDPKSTVQVRQEIPMAERIANEVAADLHDNVKARRQVADLAQDPELKAELHRLANRAEQGAKHFTEGAEQLKWEESTTREERAELAERRKHSAETMLRGRDEFLSAARDFDQALGKLGVPAAHSDYVSDVRPPADPGGLGEHRSHERSVGEHEGGSQPRPDASPGAAPDGGSSQHTGGEHQGGNDAHGNDAHDGAEHGNDAHDGAEHDGAEHPPVVPEPLPPVGTPEHGIMHDPRTFLDENLVSVDFAAGARQRMPGLKPFEENNLLKAMRGRDQHWFEMVPNPAAAATGKAGYHLVPAWEKYAEHYADFPRPSGGLPPVKEDSHYVRGAYVPYEADKRASLADLSTIGHTEVPLHPNPARPQEGLVFTDAMNGCAFVATVEPGRDTFTAWHYQSYSASDALRTAAEFRAAQTVTTWMGGGDYAAVLPPGHTPAATNMLRYGPDGWEMVSQEVQKDARNPLNPPRVSRQSVVPFEVGMQTPEAVVKMTVDPYLINAKEQLGHFDDAAYGLTKDLSLTNPHVRSLNQRMGQMREMLLEQKNLVEALQRPDASLEDIQSAAAELRAKSEEKQRFLTLHENHIQSLANQLLTDHPNRTTATLFSEFGKSDWIGVMTDDADAQIQKRDAVAQQLAEAGPIGDPAGAPQERAFEPVPDDDPRALKLAGYVGGPGNVHPPMSNTLLGHVNPNQAPEQEGTGFRSGPELNASVENVEAYRDTHFGRPRVSGASVHGDAEPATGSTPWTRPEAPAAFGKGDDAVKALMEKVQAGGKGSFATVLGVGEEGRAHAVALVHDRDGRLRWADLTERRVFEATGGMPRTFGLGWNLWASVSDPEENTISGPPDPYFTQTFGAFTAPGREH
ncbi:toxin glutamine deamidase domain-containing protein [Kitasatospora griseola]|uniref:toxin glutamine deamidase domain-containing protein n=1 Tax=Kitasatospora griseola TaxID=2064 RepID=UPI0036D933BA